MDGWIGVFMFRGIVVAILSLPVWIYEIDLDEKYKYAPSQTWQYIKAKTRCLPSRMYDDQSHEPIGYSFDCDAKGITWGGRYSQLWQILDTGTW